MVMLDHWPNIDINLQINKSYIVYLTHRRWFRLLLLHCGVLNQSVEIRISVAIISQVYSTTLSPVTNTFQSVVFKWLAPLTIVSNGVSLKSFGQHIIAWKWNCYFYHQLKVYGELPIFWKLKSLTGQINQILQSIGILTWHAYIKPILCSQNVLIPINITILATFL